MKKIISAKNIIRAGFIVLILFELAGQFGLTSFEPIYSWVSLIFTALIAWAILEVVSFYIRKYYSITLPGFFWVVFFIAVPFDAAGDFLNLYNKYKYYDNALHVLVGMLVAGPFIAWLIHAFNARSDYFIQPVLSVYLIVAGVTFLGFLYEVGEYLADTLLKTESIPTRLDSVEDMISNFLGALVVGVLFAIHQSKRKEFTPLQKGNV